jgi:hypothetical protein
VTGLTLGIVASLAANVAAARPDPLSWIVAGWLPVALAISFELLILVLRTGPVPAVVPEATAGPEAGTQAGAAGAAPGTVGEAAVAAGLVRPGTGAGTLPGTEAGTEAGVETAPTLYREPVLVPPLLDRTGPGTEGVADAGPGPLGDDNDRTDTAKVRADARRELAEHPLTEAQIDLLAHLINQPPRNAGGVST